MIGKYHFGKQQSDVAEMSIFFLLFFEELFNFTLVRESIWMFSMDKFDT